jgi:hypothetical protein
MLIQRSRLVVGSEHTPGSGCGHRIVRTVRARCLLAVRVAGGGIAIAGRHHGMRRLGLIAVHATGAATALRHAVQAVLAATALRHRGSNKRNGENGSQQELCHDLCPLRAPARGRQSTPQRNGATTLPKHCHAPSEQTAPAKPKRGAMMAFILFDPHNPLHRQIRIRWRCLNRECGEVFAASLGPMLDRYGPLWPWFPECQASS